MGVCEKGTLFYEHGISYTHISDKFTGPENIYDKKIPYPLTLNLNVTHDCNLACDYCIRQGGKAPSPSSELMKTYLTNLPVEKPLRLTLTGGEPFIRKDIYEIIDFTARQPWAVGIISNGTIPIEMKNIPKTTRFEFSVDAIDAQTYFKQRGGSEKQYQKIIENIKAAKNDDLIVRVNVMLSKNNMDHNYIEKLIDRFGNLGVDQIRFQRFVIPIGTTLDNDLLEKYQLKDNEYREIAMVAREMGYKKNIDILVPQQNKQLSLGSVRAYPDGNIAVQTKDEPDQEIIGNIGIESLEDCWSRETERLSEMHLRYLIKPTRII